MSTREMIVVCVIACITVPALALVGYRSSHIEERSARLTRVCMRVASELETTSSSLRARGVPAAVDLGTVGLTHVDMLAICGARFDGATYLECVGRNDAACMRAMIDGARRQIEASL